MRYLTTAQWRERGYLIRTGARSFRRNEWGTAVFNRDQVRKIETVRVIHVHHYHGDDY